MRARTREWSVWAVAALTVAAGMSSCELPRGRSRTHRTAVTAASKPRADPPDRTAAPILAEVTVERWLEANPHVDQDPAYTAWRQELDDGCASIVREVAAELRRQPRTLARDGDGSAAPCQWRAELVDFDPGSRDPLGHGTSRITVRITPVDGTGQAIAASSEVRGSSRLGLQPACVSCARAIAERVAALRPATPMASR